MSELNLMGNLKIKARHEETSLPILRRGLLQTRQAPLPLPGEERDGREGEKRGGRRCESTGSRRRCDSVDGRDGVLSRYFQDKSRYFVLKLQLLLSLTCRDVTDMSELLFYALLSLYSNFELSDVSVIAENYRRRLGSLLGPLVSRVRLLCYSR